MSNGYRISPQVKFAAFRDLESRRIEASNSIWAILVGADVAAKAIAESGQPSERTLAQIFPDVRHVRRFDLRADRAQVVLTQVEEDFCTMAMAHSIALHEDFLKSCLAMLVPLGKLGQSKIDRASTNTVHELFAEVTGRPLDVDALGLFHLTRLIRNCHIHAGGRVDSRLISAYGGLSAAQKDLWEDLTNETLVAPAIGDAAKVGVGGLVATLAIGKRLAYDVNLGLQLAISRETWADIATAEYLELSGKRPTDTTVLRSLRGYLRTGFTALELTDVELQAAIDRCMK